MDTMSARRDGAVVQVLPGVWQWSVYSEEHRVDLTAHVIRTPAGGLYFFDPLPLETFSFRELIRQGRPRAIVLTNENHERLAGWWRGQLGVPVFAATDARVGLGRVIRFPMACGEWEGFGLTRLEGGSRGEILFRLPGGRIALVGDAVTNLEGYGPMLLPPKYCHDQAILRHGLRQAARIPFEVLLTAHGNPMAHAASETLVKLSGRGA